MESNHTEGLATKVLSTIKARISQSNLTVIPFAAISLLKLAVLSLGVFAPTRPPPPHAKRQPDPD